MNNELSLRSATFILLVFGSILGGWLWAGIRAQDFEGAGHMHLDPQGRLYIQVGNRLFLYGPDGRFGREFDLADIGVEALAGDFAFFSNGDILLSRQPYSPSFFERISILKRERNNSEEYRQDDRESLVRCRLAESRCSRFGDSPLNLNRAFHLYVDPGSDEVYLAEGARHQVRKFDSRGREIARLDNGLEFPNQVFVQEGRLYIANTNEHEVLVVEAAGDRFGRALEHINTEVRETGLWGARWPSSMLLVNGSLWVNNMKQDMKNGSIFVFDKGAEYRKAVPLPANADPIDLVLFNDSVLISDYRNFTVYKVGLDGNRIAEFPDGSLKSFLTEQKERHDYYAGVSRWLLWVFWGALAVGFLVAIFQGLQSGSVKSLRALGVTAGIDTRNPAIIWISPDPVYRRYLRLSIILFAGMLPVVWMLGLYVGFQSVSKLLFLMALAGVVSIFLFYRITTYRIGVFNDVLILMKGKRYRAGRGEQILYSDSHVVIGNIAMPMGSTMKSFFSKKQLIEHVYPLLKGGTELNRAQLQMLLIRGMDESVIATGLLVVVLVLFVVLN